MSFTVSQDELDRIRRSSHHDPFEVLGAHVVKVKTARLVSIRAFLPLAEQAWAITAEGAAQPFERSEGTDFFEAQFPGVAEIFPYEIRVVDKEGQTRQGRDPYSFLPVLGDLDSAALQRGQPLPHL